MNHPTSRFQLVGVYSKYFVGAHRPFKLKQLYIPLKGDFPRAPAQALKFEAESLAWLFKLQEAGGLHRLGVLLWMTGLHPQIHVHA